MRRGLPTKDVKYDPAPYDAVGGTQRDGHDVAQQVVDLMTSTRIRPGLMATRLNRAGITTSDGSPWDWIKVRDTIDREVLKRGGSCGVHHVNLPHGGSAMRVGRDGSWGRPWG